MEDAAKTFEDRSQRMLQDQLQVRKRQLAVTSREAEVEAERQKLKDGKKYLRTDRCTGRTDSLCTLQNFVPSGSLRGCRPKSHLVPTGHSLAILTVD